MERHSPLDIPELLNYTMGFLEGSTSTLLQCALVARPWVNPAQLRLFRVPHLTNERISSNRFILRSFHDTLRSSPHLLGLVQELAITPDAQFHPNIVEINLVCGLAFTNLRTVKLDLQCPTKIRKQLQLASLMSHQMLRRLDLVVSGSLAECASFLRRCSPTIRHIELSFFMSDAELLGLRRENRRMAAGGAITSLQLSPWKNGPFTTLCTVDLPSLVYPFELSQLKALSIRPGYGMTVGWDSNLSIDSIQMLDIEVREQPNNLDLSIFPNLQILRIHVGSFSAAVASTLQTVSRSQPPIHTIVISTGQNLATIPSSLLQELDSVLASLPIASLELEQTNGWDPDAARFFPNLKSRNLVRFFSVVRCTFC
ncbi:hypothetical protein R3P38DRAFT_2512151 [Favolaschia claudopus]|uniref:F-box domain-containing protein n=1 Tax=Favolaschia claudopus TaxID=2862362 RepID=A0AAW0CSF9_9AGAR